MRRHGPEPLRLVFLGCGRATCIHSRVLRGIAPEVRRYYASRDPGKAASYSKRFGGEGWYHSYEAAVTDDRMQVVLVATPPALHLDWVLRAVDAGRDVIVEKPAFPASADFARVRDRLQLTRSRVLVAENYRYKPLTLALREWIARTTPEELRFIRVNAVRLQPWRGWRGNADLAGGGTLLEGGIHWVSFMSGLGLVVEDVAGYRAGNREGPDRSMVVVFRYVGGCVGTLHCSWEIRSPLRGLRLSQIYGIGRSVQFESNGLFLASAGTPPVLRVPGLRDIAGYRAMARDFLRALRTGAAPLYTLDDAERDVAFVERATLGCRTDPLETGRHA